MPNWWRNIPDPVVSNIVDFIKDTPLVLGRICKDWAMWMDTFYWKVKLCEKYPALVYLKERRDISFIALYGQILKKTQDLKEIIEETGGNSIKGCPVCISTGPLDANEGEKELRYVLLINGKFIPQTFQKIKSRMTIAQNGQAHCETCDLRIGTAYETGYCTSCETFGLLAVVCSHCAGNICFGEDCNQVCEECESGVCGACVLNCYYGCGSVCPECSVHCDSDCDETFCSLNCAEQHSEQH